MNLVAVRLRGLIRSNGITVLAVTILGLALLAIATGRWSAELIATAAGGLDATTIQQLLPEPSAAFTWEQWLGSLNQIVLLMSAVWSGYAAFTLRRDGGAATLITKPSSRSWLLATAWLVPVFALVVLAAVGSGVVSGVSVALYDGGANQLGAGRLLASFALWALNVLVYASIGALIGAVVPSLLVAIVAAVVAVMLGGILSSIHVVAAHSFAGLFPLSSQIVHGQPAVASILWATSTAAVIIIGAVGLGSWVFSREDL